MSEQTKGDFGNYVLAHGGEEPLEGFDGSLFAYPEKAGNAQINLVDQGEVFVPFGILNLIDAEPNMIIRSSGSGPTRTTTASISSHPTALPARSRVHSTATRCSPERPRRRFASSRCQRFPASFQPI